MMPLAMVEEGRVVTINSIECGYRLKKRLCDLGLYEHTKIKVIKNDISGPVIIKVKDTNLVLGRGQVSKIMVE